MLIKLSWAPSAPWWGWTLVGNSSHLLHPDNSSFQTAHPGGDSSQLSPLITMGVLCSKSPDLCKDWRQEFIVKDQESSSCFGADQWVSAGEGRRWFCPPSRENLAMSRDIWGFPAGSNSKESARSSGDPGSIPGSGRSRGEGHVYSLWNFAWRIPWMEETGVLYSPWGGKESDTTERLTLLLSKTFRLPQLWMCATGV